MSRSRPSPPTRAETISSLQKAERRWGMLVTLAKENRMPKVQDPPQARRGDVLLGVVLGAAVGFLASASIVVLAGSLYVKREATRARAGWNLVPIVVALEDVPAGAALTFDKIAQRPVPEQFVTASVVRPESASSVVDSPLLAPVKSGDPILWSQIASSMSAQDCAAACARAARAAKSPAGREPVAVP